MQDGLIWRLHRGLDDISQDGIHQHVNPEHVKVLVDAVHEFSADIHGK